MSKTTIKEFTHDDLNIISDDVIYQGFFTLKRIRFTHKLFAGGESGIVTRELLVKGQASAVIAYDPKEDKVILIEQVRIGSFTPSRESPWQIELIAGMVDTDESPQEVALREAQEEAGIELSNIEHIYSIWDSPGGTNEQLHLYVAKVDSSTAKGIHGLADEHEDIKVHVLNREEAYQLMKAGEINNGIAVTGLLWLELNYLALQKKWLT